MALGPKKSGFMKAFLVAVAHFSFYQCLNGKRVDIDTSIPQSWVSSIALLLVTTFRVVSVLRLESL
jgi:hypothetical protein